MNNVKKVSDSRYEGSLVIKFHWKCDNGNPTASDYEDALEEDALDRIFDQIKKGKCEGELSTSVRYADDTIDPDEPEDDGYVFSGWWSLNKNKINQTEEN